MSYITIDLISLTTLLPTISTNYEKDTISKSIYYNDSTSKDH